MISSPSKIVFSSTEGRKTNKFVHSKTQKVAQRVKTFDFALKAQWYLHLYLLSYILWLINNLIL